MGFTFMLSTNTFLVGRYWDFSPLPNDKILDWSKLKQIADDIQKSIENEK